MQDLKRRLRETHDTGPKGKYLIEELKLNAVVRIEELEQILEVCVSAMVKAYAECNAIRARDGVPYMYDGTKSSVTEEYFSDVVDGLDDAVKLATGKSAHCYSLLRTSGGG